MPYRIISKTDYDAHTTEEDVVGYSADGSPVTETLITYTHPDRIKYPFARVDTLANEVVISADDGDMSHAETLSHIEANWTEETGAIE